MCRPLPLLACQPEIAQRFRLLLKRVFPLVFQPSVLQQCQLKLRLLALCSLGQVCCLVCRRQLQLSSQPDHRLVALAMNTGSFYLVFRIFFLHACYPEHQLFPRPYLLPVFRLGYRPECLLPFSSASASTRASTSPSLINFTIMSISVSIWLTPSF